VVEAKTAYKTAADAVQQAPRYAEMLELKFAYATNGRDIIEIDYFTGKETVDAGSRLIRGYSAIFAIEVTLNR
jgi:type I site-specific restriction endonuclease